MSKRYLGIVCMAYFLIICYVLLFDKIKYFLAPSMQIYIKISLFPMFIIGLVLLFNNKVDYKFKISDLVLLVPIIFIILSGDGRLTSSFATNRVTKINKVKTVKVEKKENKKENKEENKKTKDTKSTDNLEKPYFEVNDKNYNELSNYITYAPKADKFVGKTIKLRGLALTTTPNLNDDYFMIGKYIISCCAADAEFTYFIVKYDKKKIKDNNWYEIEGVLEKGKDKDNYDIMYIKVVNIDEVNSKDEEQYVYPCYAYDDGKCEATSKYNLEY